MEQNIISFFLVHFKELFIPLDKMFYCFHVQSVNTSTLDIIESKFSLLLAPLCRRCAATDFSPLLAGGGGGV